MTDTNVHKDSEKQAPPKTEVVDSKPIEETKKDNQPSEAPLEFRVIIGKKLGMTQIFDVHGDLYSASVIEAGPCPIINLRTSKKDGYNAVCLGFGNIEEKKLTKPLLGQFKKISQRPVKHLKEYRVLKTDGFEVGQSVRLNGRFDIGDYVDIVGITKGKGFAGVMKRHNFSGLPASHGASDKERSPGSIASQRSLGRVIPGQKMPGHMGHRRVTVAKVEVLKIDLEKNLIYLNGSVPGAKGTIVTVQETSKPKKKRKLKEVVSKKSKKAKVKK